MKTFDHGFHEEIFIQSIFRQLKTRKFGQDGEQNQLPPFPVRI